MPKEDKVRYKTSKEEEEESDIETDDYLGGISKENPNENKKIEEEIEDIDIENDD